MVELASGTWVRAYRRPSFDAFFSESLRAVERVDATTLRLSVDSVAADGVRDLAGRDSRCCSFSGFDYWESLRDTQRSDSGS